jgi:hypothetical protein
MEIERSPDASIPLLNAFYSIDPNSSKYCVAAQQ